MTHTLWQVTVRSEQPGWLEIPPSDTIDRGAWVDRQAAALRDDWGDRWDAEVEVLARAALEHALDARRADDALCFQFWPFKAVTPVIVHIAFGVPDASIDWSSVQGALSPYELPHVGPGVQRVFATELAVPSAEEPVELLGVDLVFADVHALLHVALEPTLPALLADVGPSFHAFAGTIEVFSHGVHWRSNEQPDALGADAAWKQ